MLFLEYEQGNGRPEQDKALPSLFELMMQERMASGMKPAVEYVVQTIGDSWPQLHQFWVVQHFEESFCLLHALVEKYFLSHYDALASEKFYGIKRVMYRPVSSSSSSSSTSSSPFSPLTDSARNWSLAYAVVLPYLKAKADQYFHQLKEQQQFQTSSSSQPLVPTEPSTEEEEPQQQSQLQNHNQTNAMTTATRLLYVKWIRFLQHLQRVQLLRKWQQTFVKMYPFLHFSYEASFFLYQWLYLFGDSPYFSPLLRRLQVALVRVTPEDLTALQQRQHQQRSKLLQSLLGPSFLKSLQRSLLTLTWGIVDHSYVLLLFGIASYKFLEWMYSEEGAAQIHRKRRLDGPIPPPPLPPSDSHHQMTLPMDKSFCPLCHRKRVNPAMATSGFVFCYPCLFNYVEVHRECPVTRMKCNVSNILKIYDEHAVTPRPDHSRRGAQQ